MKGALFSKKTLAYLRNILVDRRKRLARAVEGQLSTTSSGERVKSGSNLLDAAIDSSTRDLAFQMASTGFNEVQSIDRALRRIDEGSYGLCSECGDPIAEARLKALPFAELCLKCQADYEKACKQAGEELHEVAGDYPGFDETGESEGGAVRIRGRKVG